MGSIRCMYINGLCKLPLTSNKTEKKSLTNLGNQNKIEINILIKGSFI
jgi:hypothetical protein